MPKQTKNLGVVSPVPRGDWQEGTTYWKLNFVTHGDWAYIAIRNNVNIEPGISPQWETCWMAFVRNGATKQEVDEALAAAQQALEAANASKEAAAESAANAAQSESNAAQSAQEAAGSAEAAAGSAQEAANSAEDAAQSAQEAANAASQIGAYLENQIIFTAQLPQTGEEGYIYVLISDQSSDLFSFYVWDNNAWKTIGSASLVLNTTTINSYTLAASAWQNKQQTIAIEGLTPDDDVLTIESDASSLIYINNYVRSTQVVEGGVVFTCNTVPSQNLTVWISVTKRQEIPTSNGYYTKSEVDEIQQTLQGNIDAEEQAREQADTQLQNNIDAEENARQSADTALSNRIDDVVDGTTQVASAANADAADKLNSNAGSATNPVYFSQGVPVACGDTLAKNISGTAARATGDGSGNQITTFYGHSIAFTVNSQTFVLTAQLLSATGAVLSTQTVDLPLESVVVSGDYNSETKEVELTLQNGSVISFSVADLVDGLATEAALNAETQARQTADTNLQNQINDLEDGTTPAGKATADAQGNNIANTYATKQELSDVSGEAGAAVRYDAAQSLNATQQRQARTNIGAAPLASPTFTGTPAAPNPANGADSTQIATTAWVRDIVPSIKVNKAGTADNATQLGGAAASAYAKLASPAFTGTPTAPNPSASDDSTKIATTSWVRDIVPKIASNWTFDTNSFATSGTTVSLKGASQTNLGGIKIWLDGDYINIDTGD